MKRSKALKVKNKEQMRSIVSLARHIWREHYTPIIGAPQVEYMLDKFQSREAVSDQIKNKNHSYYLLTINGKRIGYFAFVPRKKDLFLSKFYLTAEERGKGFGKETLDFIEEKAREKNLYLITLRVNKNNSLSIKAYEKMGFSVAGSLVTDIGNGYKMDDHRMQKKLDPSG